MTISVVPIAFTTRERMRRGQPSRDRVGRVSGTLDPKRRHRSESHSRAVVDLRFEHDGVAGHSVDGDEQRAR
jgi:hypothetical protein